MTQGFENNEFSMHYQMQRSVSDGCIYGYEALLRWNRQGGGEVSPSVFIPYADLSFYAQHENDERFIDASYLGAESSLSEAAKFSLPTDGVDSDYKIYSIGMSAVVRGARQTSFGSAASGGVQLYVNYRQVEDIGNYSQTTIAGGLRYEF